MALNAPFCLGILERPVAQSALEMSWCPCYNPQSLGLLERYRGVDKTSPLFMSGGGCGRETHKDSAGGTGGFGRDGRLCSHLQLGLASLWPRGRLPQGP